MTGGGLGESRGRDPLRRKAEPASAKEGPGEQIFKTTFLWEGISYSFALRFSGHDHERRQQH